MNNLFKVNISAVIFKGDKILIQKRSLDEDVYPGLWGIPGGTMELKDKNLEETLRREVMEETNILIKNINIVSNNTRLKKEYSTLYVMCVADYDNGRPEANDGTQEILWLDIKNIDLYEFTPLTKEFILEMYDKRKSSNNSF